MNDEETSNGTSTKITGYGHYAEKEFTGNEGWDKKKTYNPETNMDYNGLRYINTRNKNLKTT